MAMMSPEKPVKCVGGLGGSLRETSLDLSRAGDVALLQQAVVNHWDVSPEMRESLVAQFKTMSDAAYADFRRNPGRQRRFFRVAEIMLSMQAMNLRVLDVLEGRPVRWPAPRPRRRNENRRPRWMADVQRGGTAR